MKKRNLCARECVTPVNEADFSAWPVDALLSAHQETYRAMAPTIREYAKLGERVVKLQKEIFLRRAREFCPLATMREQPFVCRVSLHEKLESIEELWKNLRAKDATVTEIIFDPVRNEFHLWGSLPSKPI